MIKKVASSVQRVRTQGPVRVAKDLAARNAWAYAKYKDYNDRKKERDNEQATEEKSAMAERRHKALLASLAEHPPKVPPLLRTRVRHVAKANPSEAADMLHALRGFELGDFSDAHKVVRHLDSKAESEALLEAFPDIMAAEVQASGASRLLELMSVEGYLEFDELLIEHTRKALEAGILELKSRSVQSRKDDTFTTAGALLALQDLREKLAEHGTRFFLSSGTLLGAYRENRILPNDYDVDVGVFASEVDLAGVTRFLVSRGYELVSYLDDFVHVRHVDTGVNIDIFPYVAEGDLVHYGTEIHRWWHRPFELETMEFDGEEFLIPTDIEQHLTERYGNWQTRTLFYDLSYDGPNRTYSNTVESLLYLYLRSRNALAGGWRFYSGNATAELRDNFGVDMSQYVPRAVNPHLIPLPLKHVEVEGRRVVVVVGDFNRVDAQMLASLESARTDADYLIAAVLANTLVGDPNLRASRDRINVVRSLKPVDHAVVLNQPSELDSLVAFAEATNVVDLSQPSTMKEDSPNALRQAI